MCLQALNSSSVIFSCSNWEAQNYGIFLNELLTLLRRWEVRLCS